MSFMINRPRPRSGRRLSRDQIAHAALELIDREGLDALSMRRVAAELHVDPMRLYRTVPNRDGMISDVVALLLSEVDTSERPGETWDETMRRATISEYAMAMRHPNAFLLVALARRDREPVLTYARRLMDLLVKGGLPERRFFDVWLVDGAFSDGFLLLATATLTQSAQPDSLFDAEVDPNRELAAGMAATLSEEAFTRGLNLIYTGLKDTFSSEAEVG